MYLNSSTARPADCTASSRPPAPPHATAAARSGAERRTAPSSLSVSYDVLASSRQGCKFYRKLMLTSSRRSVDCAAEAATRQQQGGQHSCSANQHSRPAKAPELSGEWMLYSRTSASADPVARRCCAASTSRPHTSPLRDPRTGAHQAWEHLIAMGSLAEQRERSKLA